MVSARLGLLEAPLGTLIAYRPEPEPDAVVARSTKVVADVLTDTALHPGTLIDVEDGLPLHPLFGDSDLRVVVHQATGMIMSSRQCTASDALALIRAHAYSLDESVIEVARMIVDRTTALN
ncbi:ANTAR domain-containing protein [Amycolatopsis sp. NPDC089917]|uniref:ANTAR domain-containing protein n=1 Tax=Amycolatopsis sp. NPDC089917 TaxID=3155187 RepID=UPI003433BF98